MTTSRQIMTNRHRHYAGFEKYGEQSQSKEEHEYQKSVTIVGSDSASVILFDVDISEFL